MPRSSLLLLALLAACSPEVGISKQSFDMDSDGYSSEVDCDDAHATINPDAPESCDGKDNNCDGVVDEDATDAPTWYVDADGDGVGAESVTGCVAPEGAVATNGDCDDDRAGVHPGAEEHCDGVDEDCDGRVDEDAVDMQSWYADADGDGYGAGSAQPACEGGAGQVAVAGDCDDAAAERHPGAEEADCADLTDYNCDGSVGYTDAGGDGFPACTDCDDGAGTVHPGAGETCNGVDDNCDGTTDEGVTVTWYGDVDGDGYGDATVPAYACTAPAGYVADATDCDDGLADIHPGAPERCDGLDQDCDGAVDENVMTRWYADGDADGYGDAATGVDACAAPAGNVADATDCDDTRVDIHPGAVELCDGLDQDCDGMVDEAAADAPTWYTDADGDGYGDAATLTLACEAGSGAATNSSDCDDTDASIHPGATETIDGQDDNCDGMIDNTGAWHSERITSSAYWQLDSKVNAGDEFILGYLNTSAYMRVLVGNSSQGWASHSITSASTNSPAVAFGTAGDYHILYRTNTRQAFQGHFDGSSWSTTRLDTDCGPDNGWQHTAIDVADDGTVYSYYDDTTSAYSFFYRGSYGAMSVYRTATGTIYGSRQALDPVTGDIAYAYMASTWNPLWRLSDATGTSYASGGLDSGGRSSSRVGSGVTVAYGPDGTLYAAWHDAVEGDIKFATYDAALASWTTETVSSPAGYYPHDLDLTIDSVGNAHIVYAMNYGTNGYYPLTYATNSSGSWALTSLATAADHPTFCEIQVDSMDMVHIFGILDTSKYLMHYYIY